MPCFVNTSWLDTEPFAAYLLMLGSIIHHETDCCKATYTKAHKNVCHHPELCMVEVAYNGAIPMRAWQCSAFSIHGPAEVADRFL